MWFSNEHPLVSMERAVHDEDVEPGFMCQLPQAWVRMGAGAAHSYLSP